MGRWLTPDSITGDNECYQVTIPPNCASYLFGALALLTNESNWEDFGAVTSAEISQAFLNLLINPNLNRVPCTESVIVVEVGTIVAWAAETLPDGWLWCNGQLLTVAAYPDLYNVLGVVWGGSAGTNFNLPDLRLVFPLGAGALDEIASEGGEDYHTLTIDEMPEHAHSLQMQTGNVGSGATAFYRYAAVPQVTTAPTGGGQPHNNLPPFVTVNFIIKVDD